MTFRLVLEGSDTGCSFEVWNKQTSSLGHCGAKGVVRAGRRVLCFGCGQAVAALSGADYVLPRDDGIPGVRPASAREFWDQAREGRREPKAAKAAKK